VGAGVRLRLGTRRFRGQYFLTASRFVFRPGGLSRSSRRIFALRTVRLIAERLLPVRVPLPAVPLLVLAPALAGAGRVPELAAVPHRAVALAAILRDADPELIAAVETLDLVELEVGRTRPRHSWARRTSTTDPATGTLYCHVVEHPMPAASTARLLPRAAGRSAPPA
jgi:hypothetical protein